VTRAALIAACLLLSGCVTGIPDAGPPPPPKPEPCEVWIVVYPDRTAQCVSREHMRRKICGTLVRC